MIRKLLINKVLILITVLTSLTAVYHIYEDNLTHLAASTKYSVRHNRVKLKRPILQYMRFSEGDDYCIEDHQGILSLLSVPFFPSTVQLSFITMYCLLFVID